MRYLLLGRHADAGATPAGGTDRDRELTGPGLEQARRLGAALAAGELPLPQAVLTSDAVRTRQTWATAAQAAGSTVAATPERALYGGPEDVLVAAVRELDPAVETAALIGHAPDVPGLVTMLPDARGEDAAPLWRWDTATVGVIEVPGSWAEFPAGARVVDVRWFPAD